MLEYDRKKLGIYVKAERERTGLTQSEVAKALGYTSAQFISNIERGVSVVPLRTLARMLSLYRVKPDRAIKMIMESQGQLLRAKLKRAK